MLSYTSLCHNNEKNAYFMVKTAIITMGVKINKMHVHYPEQRIVIPNVKFAYRYICNIKHQFCGGYLILYTENPYQYFEKKLELHDSVLKILLQ